MNVSARRTAMFSAISKKLADGELFIVDKFEVAEGKTKEVLAFVNAMNFDKTVLMVMGETNDLVRRAARNLPKVSTMPSTELSTYEVVKNKAVVLDVATVKALEEVYGE